MENNIQKVSVLMAVFNGENFLKEAIRSVLSQTFKEFELVIMDDGSTDKSAEIIYSFTDTRIKYFKKEHSGLIDSLNFGLEKCNGEFIARFDADDICEPNRLEEQTKFFEENPANVLVGSFATRIDENGNEIGQMHYPPKKWEEIKKYTIFHNPFIHPSVMFRKALIGVVGPYKKKYQHIEDYELWTRVVNKYPCENIDKPLIRYRVHKNQVTKKSIFKMKLRGVLVRTLAVWRFIFKF